MQIRVLSLASIAGAIIAACLLTLPRAQAATAVAVHPSRPAKTRAPQDDGIWLNRNAVGGTPWICC